MAETLYGILQVAIRKALNELGEPTPDYPAPVANAVEILKQALKDTIHPANEFQLDDTDEPFTGVGDAE